MWHIFFSSYHLSEYLFEGCSYLCFVLDSDVELVMLILVFDTGCRGERLDKELKELLKESEDIRKISEISDQEIRKIVADLLDLFFCSRRKLEP